MKIVVSQCAILLPVVFFSTALVWFGILIGEEQPFGGHQ